MVASAYSITDLIRGDRVKGFFPNLPFDHLATSLTFQADWRTLHPCLSLNL